MDVVNIIFAISAILITGSYAFKDILVLRLLAVTGGFGYVLGSFFMAPGAAGKFSLIFFSSLNMFINLYHSVIIVLNRLPILLPEHLKSLYTDVFSLLTPKEFISVYHLAEQKQLNENTVLTRQDEPVPNVVLITAGKVDILKDDEKVNTLDRGFFIGEMSYFSGKSASSTTKVSSHALTCLSWEKSQLDALEGSAPILFSKLKHIISLDLVKKIERGIS